MPENQTPPQQIYDEHYFKHACGGHAEFAATMGEKLSPWMEKVLNMADLQPGQKVLDLGTGRGEIAFHAARQGCLAVGLDYAMAAVEIAKFIREKSRAEDRDFTLMLSDARCLPFTPDQFDIVFMLDIVEHLSPEDLDQTLKQVRRVLKPNGRLIIHTMPNLNYYKFGYPIYRALNKVLGKDLPKDPRDRFYHGEVHVNIQTPRSLRGYLHQAGFDQVDVRLTQLSGSPFKIALCRLFPLKYVLANDILATARK